MYIKFKNGKEVTTLEPKRGLTGVKFQNGVNYVTIKKPIDIIRIDKDERIQLAFQKNIGDLSINQFIIDGKPGYLNINECIPLKIDKLIINESSQINNIHKSTVNEIIVKEGVRVSIHLESVKVVTSYGALNLNLSKNTIDRDKSCISDETWFNFDVKRDENGKILFFFDENYENLVDDILSLVDDNYKFDYEYKNPYSLIVLRYKNYQKDLDKIKNYSKEKLGNFIDGEAIHGYLIEKYEKELFKTKEELTVLREELNILLDV
jgi:hypothetical protein